MMHSETLLITPDFARQLLARHPDYQRGVRDPWVDQYARDMYSGDWKISHQGLAFDEDGNLLDGQHRLWAVIEANVSVPMYVTYDVPRDSFECVDRGFMRTNADAMRASGYPWITNLHTAVARFMISNDSPGILTGRRSVAELREAVLEYSDAVKFVMESATPHVRGVTVAPVLAAAGLAYYTEKDHERLRSFLTLLVDGVARDPKYDSTVIRFRDHLRDTAGTPNSASRMDTSLKAQRVIKAYMSREVLNKIYTPASPCYLLPARRPRAEVRTPAPAPLAPITRFTQRQEDLVSGPAPITRFAQRRMELEAHA